MEDHRVSQPRSIARPAALAFGALAILWSLAVVATAVRPPVVRTTIAPADIQPEVGKAWIARAADGVWPWVNVHDVASATTRSRLTLLEDGVELGPAHSLHDEVRQGGGGAYSHSIEMLRFSTPDGSDPRANGRRYEMRWPAAPSALGVAIASVAIAAGACLCLAWILRRTVAGRRLLRVAPTGVRAAASVVAAMVALLAVAVAIAAWWTRAERWTVERIVPPKAMLASDPEFDDLRDRIGDAADGLRKIHLTNTPMERYVAPFVELVVPEIGRRPRIAEVRFGETPLRRVASREAFGEAVSTLEPVFVDTHDSILISAPGLDGLAAAVRLPARVSLGGVVLAAALAAAAVALAARMTCRRSRPTLAGAGRVVVAACAVIGAALLALNVIGLFTSLRPPSIVPGVAPPGGGHGANDVRVDWDGAREDIARRRGEPDVEYSERLTRLVADTMAHAWIPAESAALNMQLPATENWLLWLLGEWTPGCREIRLSDPWMALERGVGMCDQVSQALAALLQDEGIDGRIATLDGHAVVFVHQAGRVVAILDPDYGVVFHFGPDEAPNRIDTIRTSYLQAMERSGLVEGGTIASILTRAVAAPPVHVAAPGTPLFGGLSREREAQTGVLKWAVPVALLAAAVLIRVAFGRRSTVATRSTPAHPQPALPAT